MSFALCAVYARANQFPLTGRIVGIEAETTQLVVAHEPIAGYMGAMTMPFRVTDGRELRGLRVGDRISAELSVTDNDASLSELRKSGEEVATAFPLTHVPARARQGVAHELAIGEVTPEISGVDERGQPWALANFRGRVVALTFIYTRCPLPTYCPLMSHNFATTRVILEKLKGNSADRFQFLSLSLDPTHDGGAVLVEYAKAFRTEPRGWLFATAAEAQLHAFGDAVGLEFRATPSAIDHNLRTVVIDCEGRVRKIFRGNAWTPQELASEMQRAR